MSFAQYLLKRTARFLATLFTLLSIIFVLFRIMPGDPTTMMVHGRFTEEQLHTIRESFGLTKPLHEQYYLFIINALQGDFGLSFSSQEPVMDLIVPKLINTLIVVVPGMVVIVSVAYLLGSYAGWQKGSTSDKIASYTLLSFRAIPHFVLGVLLLMIFAYWLDVMPIGGMVPLEGAPEGVVPYVIVVAHHALLPFVVFTLHYAGDAFLLMRGNVISQRNEDYVGFLRLKGLPEHRVRQHASKNSMLPLITYLPTLILIGIGGQILIEVVFSWPGIGEFLVRSVRRRDFPVAQASFFFIGFGVILGNFVVDILYGFLDPRIKQEG